MVDRESLAALAAVLGAIIALWTARDRRRRQDETKRAELRDLVSRVRDGAREVLSTHRRLLAGVQRFGALGASAYGNTWGRSGAMVGIERDVEAFRERIAATAAWPALAETLLGEPTALELQAVDDLRRHDEDLRNALSTMREVLGEIDDRIAEIERQINERREHLRAIRPVPAPGRKPTRR